MKTDKDMLRDVLDELNDWERRFRPDGWGTYQLRLHRELADKVSKHLKNRVYLDIDDNEEW